MILRVALLLAAAVLVSCQVARVEEPNRSAIPSGSIVAQAGEATGPAVELGSGQAAGVGWRYAIYPAGDEWCTQFETVEVATAGCGDLLPEAGQAFGSVGRLGAATGTPGPIEGMVSEEVATVWLVDEDSGGRVPAILMPLDDAGLEGSAFIGFTPEGMTITHLQALKLSGEIVETYELP